MYSRTTAMTTPSIAPSSASTSSSRSTTPNPPRDDASSRLEPGLPPAIPAQVLRKVIALQLGETGFEAAQGEALEFLEGALYSFFGSLLGCAHELAELSRRHEPTLQDVIESCRYMGVADSPLQLLPPPSTRGGQQRSTDLFSIRYARSSTRNWTKDPALLPSDDEDPAFSDPEPDPAFDSPPPSPRLDEALDESDDDDEDEFEEVVPLGQDGQPIPGAKESKNVRKREKQQRRVEREQRIKERERRRKAREFRNREYGKTFEPEWAPKLPPKHSWKQTPVFPEQPAPPPIPDPVSRTAQAPSALALAHLSTLRSRLNDSQLVASSLRNLIRRTGASARGYPSLSTSNSTTNPNGSTSTSGATAANDGVTTTTTTALSEEQEKQAAVVAAEVAAEQEADLVSYENEWYGSNKAILKSAVPFKKGKRSVRTIRVGRREKQRGGGPDGDGEGSDDEGEGERSPLGGGRDGRNFGTAGDGGGVAKRRRWLV